MSRLILRYTVLKEKRFNKWATLRKFLREKAFDGIEVVKEEKGVLYKLPVQGKNWR